MNRTRNAAISTRSLKLKSGIWVGEEMYLEEFTK